MHDTPCPKSRGHLTSERGEKEKYKRNGYTPRAKTKGSGLAKNTLSFFSNVLFPSHGHKNPKQISLKLFHLQKDSMTNPLWILMKL